ncbi:DegT/DnrJ/EryC1/StrS aminotransferase [Caldithrix abyssi DSM 13497]|uniref:DegT/DnrJ/EryC1/StrS aminotransferase n=1 Tax=Caldithrix abyssi DSM 13497 TaxID=880073 RepID=H1XRC7_CALAY|nr:DegT/DnrJ/EryC1/StrS family aminotransferase [Caldithrix abyssi]APF18398.1 dTDP-4-amino-4,6-dideoxygalactose transaminase [Caldithrix abyssi DSM 13497]EHO42408.1 DegT/DnrJ/EryC1/StrS aminotransferase [Caldithrix abyssi DSM 13497]
MQVPLLDLKAQYRTIKHEIDPVVQEVIESQYFILGPKVAEFEEAVANYCQANYALGVSSGTDALLIALMAIDIQPGDEVITTTYSFFATAGSIARLHAKPVFVDIDPQTFNIDPAKIEDKITEKTRAIIPVHLYGQMADMDPIMEIARKHNLYVIEDAAQAIGSEYVDGRRAGSIGHIGCFSFFPSKNLGGFGDGGLVTTNDEKLYEKLKYLRNHGAHPKYYHKMIGGNFRLDALQAAVLNVKLKHLDEWTAGRQKNADFYDQGIEQRALQKYVTPPVRKEGYRHIFNQYILRAQKRDELVQYLKEHQIGCEIYYPVTFNNQECFKYLGYGKGDFPLAEKAADETLAIPIYPELTDDQKNYVLDTILNFYK